LREETEDEKRRKRDGRTQERSRKVNRSQLVDFLRRFSDRFLYGELEEGDLDILRQVLAEAESMIEESPLDNRPITEREYDSETGKRVS
jgi:hypothetical protein